MPNTTTLQQEVAVWLDSSPVLQQGTAESFGRKLAEEVWEFAKDLDPEEAADVAICLYAIAHRNGFNLDEEIRFKLDYLKTCEWVVGPRPGAFMKARP